MKKIVLTSLLAAFAVSAANAETNYFVGGAANIGTGKDHVSVLGVAPEFGWNYDENWDFGVRANLNYDHNDFLPTNYSRDGDAYQYGAGVFARYKVASFGGVKLLLKGYADIDFVTLDFDDAGIDSETVTFINAGVVPMITYDLTESFTLYANLNFLEVKAAYLFENKDLRIDDGWTFGANADFGNIANTSDFQIGFTYNF